MEGYAKKSKDRCAWCVAPCYCERHQSPEDFFRVDRDHFIERLSIIIGETQTVCFASAAIPNLFSLVA
jgi:hypothetical protein